MCVCIYTVYNPYSIYCVYIYIYSQHIRTIYIYVYTYASILISYTKRILLALVAGAPWSSATHGQRVAPWLERLERDKKWVEKSNEEMLGKGS